MISNNKIFRERIIPIIILFVIMGFHPQKKATDITSAIQWKWVNDNATYIAPSMKKKYGTNRCYQHKAYLRRIYHLQLPHTNTSKYQPIVDSITQEITHILFKTSHKNFRVAANKDLKKSKDILDDLAKVAISDDCIENGSLYEYYADSLSYNKHNLLSLKIDRYFYMGGSTHGYESTTALNYDLDKCRTIDAQQFFRKGTTQAIRHLIIKHLRDEYEITDKDSEAYSQISYDDVSVSDNFYLTDKEIVFFFNPYEIACYACGIISVDIPYKEIGQYINESYISSICN